MKVKILKGKFTASVTGSTVRIQCNICNKDQSDYVLPVHGGRPTGPQESDLQTAKQLMEASKDKKSFRQAIAGVEHQFDVERPDFHSRPPDPMKGMVIAPVTMVGRVSGYQPVVCFYCRQIGLIAVEAERPNTGKFGFQPMALNENAEIHARRRPVMTLISLLALDFLVSEGLSPRSTVVCAGASLQCQGKSSRGSDLQPRQDAHQILREFGINGMPLYELVRASRASDAVKNVVTYSHGVISHLDSSFNLADGLVERNITVLMIDLAHQILNGSLRRIARFDNLLARYVWGILMARYRYAVAMALLEAPHGPMRDTLLFYAGIVDRMFEEGPSEMISKGLESLCIYFSGELRMMV